MKQILLSLLISVLAMASIRPDPTQIDFINAVYNQKWYSGYLDLEDNSTHMHYFFFPSQRSPQKDQILFWFNGGPGCSSLLGALYEHGPFIFSDAFGSTIQNPFSWNKKINVVYLESPAQVGFSYMDGKPPTWTDDLVAKLNAKAIREFFQVWTEHQNKDVYISGESYGGIYVPTAFYELHSTAAQNPLKFNLKGFAVGNGCTDPLQCGFQNDYPVFQIQLYRDLGFISQERYDNIDSKCKNQGSKLPDDCQKVLDDIDQIADGLNIYDVLRPCYQNTMSNEAPLSMKQMRRLALRIKRSSSDKLSDAPPCVDSYAIDQMLKDKDIRKKLGIPEQVIDYSICNDNDDFDYTVNNTGSLWVYQKLIPLNKYKITVYSGNSDPCVPYAGTITWINKLRKQFQLATQQYWRPWFTTTNNGRQNSGSTWTLSNHFKLVVFKGVGHMAPQWNPEGGYKMINDLVNNETI